MISITGQIHIRPFVIGDKSAVMDMMQLHVPAYFHHDEIADFEHYLTNEIQHYFVVTFSDKIIASGGINLSEDLQTGFISWDIVHPEFQGQSAGSALLQYRIEFLQQQYAVQTIVVRTSQLVYPFYAKHGFVLKSTYPDFWAKGYDMYFMELDMRS
jgi:ribosomal-protein-alanine N-acetyltransferase